MPTSNLSHRLQTIAGLTALLLLCLGCSSDGEEVDPTPPDCLVDGWRAERETSFAGQPVEEVLLLSLRSDGTFALAQFYDPAQAQCANPTVSSEGTFRVSGNQLTLVVQRQGSCGSDLADFSFTETNAFDCGSDSLSLTVFGQPYRLGRDRP